MKIFFNRKLVKGILLQIMQHNPITLRRRQEIISAFSTNTCAMSRRQVLRIRKISTKGYLLALNSENQINRKCIEDSKEYNY